MRRRVEITSEGFSVRPGPHGSELAVAEDGVKDYIAEGSGRTADHAALYSWCYTRYFMVKLLQSRL